MACASLGLQTLCAVCLGPSSALHSLLLSIPSSIVRQHGPTARCNAWPRVLHAHTFFPEPASPPKRSRSLRRPSHNLSSTTALKVSNLSCLCGTPPNIHIHSLTIVRFFFLLLPDDDRRLASSYMGYWAYRYTVSYVGCTPWWPRAQVRHLRHQASHWRGSWLLLWSGRIPFLRHSPSPSSPSRVCAFAE